MIVRKTEPREQARASELFAIAFEQPLSREAAPAEPRLNWAAFDDSGEMMSTFVVNDFQIRFDGHSCKMAGIGGVATLPQFRRRGGIRSCFEAALPDLYREGYDFSYLYPFSSAFYRQFGYENCVQKYSTTLDLGLLKPGSVKGSFRLAESSHPMTDAIRRLDADWESRFNMMVLHDDRHYRWTKHPDPAATGEFTYVYFDAASAPKSYVTFHTENQEDGRNLICTRFCFADAEGFDGLMNLFKCQSSDHRFVKFQLPAVGAMTYLMPEWSLGAARWTLQPGGMVRVVNVRSVLEKARYIDSGSLTLEIRDPLIPENNGSFALTFENGQAVSVTPVPGPGDITLEIPTFSALIAGAWDFADAGRWMDGLEVRRETPCLSQVFYRKNMLILEPF